MVKKLKDAKHSAAVRELLQAASPSPLQNGRLLWALLADGCVVALLALSIWLLVRAAEQPPILYLNFAVVGVRAIAIGRAAFRYFERLASHDAAFRKLTDLRVRIFQALVPRVPGGLTGASMDPGDGSARSDAFARGEILARYVDDVDQLVNEPLRVRMPLLSGGLVTLLSLVSLALISPLAALITALALVLGVCLSLLLAKKLSFDSEARLSQWRAQLQAQLLQRAESAAVLQAFAAHELMHERIFAAQQQLSRIQRRAALSQGVATALLALCAGAATLLVLLCAGPELAAAGENAAVASWFADSIFAGLMPISVPLFAVLVVVPAAMAEVFAAVPLAVLARRRVLASAASLAALEGDELPKHVPVDVSAAGQALAVVHPQARPSDAPVLEVRELTAGYSAIPVLNNLSFTLCAGQTLVVQGASGSGKSTLAQVLVRFLEYRGSVLLYGSELRDLGERRVRELVGLCEQQPHIFNSDLRQNLKFAKPDASDAQLLAVLERVGLGEWTRSRGGLDARMGEAGALISGGQAQRIALARVLLRDFPVVVLDEPTAGVDTALAQQLLAGLLDAVPQDRAVLLITHTALPEGADYQLLQI